MKGPEARDRAYAKLFGVRQYQSFTGDEQTPRIEVRRYTTTPVSNGPECDVWVTSGMSDQPMRSDSGQLLRRELVLYAPKGRDYSAGLRAIARFPFDEHTYLDHGHTVQIFGAFLTPDGARKLATRGVEAVDLPHLLLTVPLLKRHQQLDQELKIEGIPVEFLWLIPISAAEHALKKVQGGDALMALFDEHELPWLFDPQRKSYL